VSTPHKVHSNEAHFMRRIRELDSQVSSGSIDPTELPDNVIMVVDRLDASLVKLAESMAHADERRMGHIYPKTLRMWLANPSHGDYIVQVFNRVDRQASHIMGDDFGDLLEGILPMMADFMPFVGGNRRVAWTALLSPVTQAHFTLWFRSKQS
jgi:hypothetical protein